MARLVSLEGAVETKSSTSANWTPATLNQQYCVGDALRTDNDSRAAVRLINETLLRLDNGSAITFTSIVKKERSILDLLKGAVHFISRTPRSLEIRTPFVNAAIEGTEFVVRVGDAATDVTVYEGLVVAKNNAGSVELTANQTGRAETGQAPVRIAVAKPRDAVAWALYYPPLPEEPGAADNLAQQAISAIVKNQLDEAAALAQQAITADPQSAAAYMAQSYVDQARFDIPAALSHSRKAAELAPGSALTQARLAEVWLMNGNTKKAKRTAADAVALNPDLSLTQSVLGFTSLRDVNLDNAKAAFEKAIQLDSAAPLPRLGLGLLKIRRGHLRSGREEIETAALLDPNNALLRSYMGKAYYEEKRSQLASEQFTMAKELDPNDPTAWFYDSILLQSENRPVEALQAQQKAIDLNDNRAVYRSRQLLDQDEAARNTASARIYSDLGFEKLAINEGAKALANAPDNFSAHRFMADINATQPQRDLAVDSDLLQSKLLQPLNANTLRPQLSDLQLADGPARFSYNEFNPLFTQSGPSLLLDGFVAENNTWGEDVIVSYLNDRFSLSLGQYHYESDGFRDFDSLEKDTLTAFAQFDITPDTMIQIEYSDDEQENGDLNQHFFSDVFNNPGLVNNQDQKNVRLGLRHHITENSFLAANISDIDQDKNIRQTSSFVDLFPETPDDTSLEDSESQSGQLIWSQGIADYRLLAGASIYETKKDEVTTVNLPGALLNLPVPFIADTFNISEDIEYTNLFIYSYIPVFQSLNLTLGLNGSMYDINNETSDASGTSSMSLDKNRLNPKLGLIWDITNKTRLRLAAYRSPLTDPINNTTLEPTQIAGFNQHFSDYKDSFTLDSKRYGVALGQEFTKSLSAGISYLYSDLDSFILPVNAPNFTVSSNRVLGEAYIYYTPSKHWSLRASYEYEKFDEPTELGTGINDLVTHRVPLGVSYFSPVGFTTGLTATYYKQTGDFVDFSDPTQPQLHGEDSFVLVDGYLSYNLPNRLGKVSLGAKNLFDENFQYEDRENNTIFNPDQSTNLFELSPERIVYGKFSLNF